MERVIFLVTVLALSAAASGVHAQGNPQAGLAEAQQVCSECHAIQKGQVRSPNSKSPTFVELALPPGNDGTRPCIGGAYDPHAGMPMFILTTERRENVIAYILSLKGGN
jgi:mono/diheme cytochrome c family protein